MRPPVETAVSAEWLERILALAGNGMILVGGQALAFWSAYYGAAAPIIAISKDVDLIGTKADVERLARGLNARAVFPRKADMTLLVGQVAKDLPGGNYIHIDVMSGVYGDLTTEGIATRAVKAQSPAGDFLVLHPLDVLQGRLQNVYGLPAKQDEHGIAQLHLAVDVARRFILDIAALEAIDAGKSARPVVRRHLGRIERLARSDAGRKVAKRYDIHVADAIDPAPVKHIESFMSRKLPQLMKLMSPRRRDDLLDSG